mgnify:CR=1 FL=1
MVIMKKTLFVVALLSLIVSACQHGSSDKAKKALTAQTYPKTGLKTNIAEKTISTRFVAPGGYKRRAVDSSSFAYYLRQLPLKPSVGSS